MTPEDENPFWGIGQNRGILRDTLVAYNEKLVKAAVKQVPVADKHLTQ